MNDVASTPNARPPEIRVEGLVKAFGDQSVLSGVDLQVGRRDILAIVGGSGCGKTVLLEHMIGHLEPDSGRVLVADLHRTCYQVLGIDADKEYEINDQPVPLLEGGKTVKELLA